MVILYWSHYLEPLPPHTISAIEPDTRGAVTIRETLSKHRNVQSCANCHQHIDPPGFALESFNPIGGFRIRYRTTEKGQWTNNRLHGRQVYEYRWRRHVDASGVTSDGQQFAGIRRFRDLLMKQEEQVARNLVSQLMVYATGSEIQFSDRDEIERILKETEPKGFPVRTLIHEVVQSKLFKNK